MAKESMTVIKLDPDSELAHVLAEKDARTVVLESEGVRYTVKRDDEDPWANYDAAKLREALHEAAGMLTPEEGERMKELIYRGREEGTRPPDRP
jgi:hypothetical protein